MKKNLKSIFYLLALTAVLILPYFVFAQASNNPMLQTMTNVATNGGYNTEDGGKLSTIVSTIIQTALSLLGVIFIILTVIGGYRYMTAGGNDQNVEKAKNYIQRALIGVIITFSAWTIWTFLLEGLIMN